ncbi:unnamed protein product [Sphagnum jensenii]|uniref:Uncharacterized protein n=1 Tax=Sphagnum jensenii TaxID=128206 RepID=A0ABP1BJP3_9BRYO
MAEIWKGRPNTPPAPPPPPPPTTSLCSSSSSSRIPITISRILSTTIWLPSSARQGLEIIKSKVLKNVIAGYGPSQQQGYYQQGPMVMGPPQQQGYYGQQIQQQGCIDIWYFLFEFRIFSRLLHFF